MKENEVREKLKYVIEKFYNNDSALLYYETDGPLVAERCISARIAMYLQEEFKYYNVDCEYNRHGVNKKVINNKAVYPDIIIHKRKNDDNNLAWIEMKKDFSLEIDKDRERLKNVTSQNKAYKYQYGFLIIIGDKRENIVIEEYVNGDKIWEVIGNV